MRISILEKKTDRFCSVDPQSTQLSEREKGSGVEREGNVGKFIL